MRDFTHTLLQLVRYGIVGIATNGLMFAGYLGLGTLGIGPKAAMSLLYVPGVLLGFLWNRSFTFHHRGNVPLSMARYLSAYAVGFVFTFAALLIFVDWLGLPADPVVLVLIFVTAALLYCLQRYWVFRQPASGSAGLLELR